MRKTIFVLLLTFFATVSVGKSAEMKRYVDYYLGFELSYPASYRITDLPCGLARWFAGMGFQNLLYLSTGTGRSQGNIRLILDRRPFNLGTLETVHAHTGWVKPHQVRIGAHTFYYYGAGGGGTTYTDDYLYDLNGLTLEISFDGPYPPGSKSPSKETRKIEAKVLESFRVLRVTAPREWHRH